MGKKGAIKKIGGVKNHEEFCGKRILGSLFGKIYLGYLTQETYSRKTCSGNLIHENLLGKTYSGKFIQENLFMKTIGHTKSLRKWPVDVLNSIFVK